MSPKFIQIFTDCRIVLRLIVTHDKPVPGTKLHLPYFAFKISKDEVAKKRLKIAWYRKGAIVKNEWSTAIEAHPLKRVVTSR